MLVGRARVDVPSRTPGHRQQEEQQQQTVAPVGRSRGAPPMILSRIAESMFWIGRYVERAEDTARLLQTHLRLLVEDSSTEIQASANLLALMSVEGVEDPTHADLLRLLAYDRREPSSIFSCWAAARDNARRAREVIPLDLWECINTTWHQLPSGGFGVAGPPRPSSSRRRAPAPCCTSGRRRSRWSAASPIRLLLAPELDADRVDDLAHQLLLELEEGGLRALHLLGERHLARGDGEQTRVEAHLAADDGEAADE